MDALHIICWDDITESEVNVSMCFFLQQSPAVLAQHVLAEVPKQVQEYFNKRGIIPLPPKGPTPPSLGGL